jgi:hypothetical protein
MTERVCIFCNNTFDGYKNAKYCIECKKQARNKSLKKYNDKKKKQIDLNIIEKEDGEEFKQLKENPNYYISNKGRILSKNGFIKPYLNKVTGYFDLNLCENSKHKHYTLHRLLSNNFIPNDDETKTLVDHINRNRQDNRIDNLRWVNYKENANNSENIFKRKPCIKIDKRIINNKEYIYYRVYYNSKDFNDKKKYSKRFKTKEEAESFYSLIF